MQTNQTDQTTEAPAELYAGQAKELADRASREQRLADASRRIFPGSLCRAFAAQGPVVAGLTLRPVTLGDLAILRRLDHPLLSAIEQIGDMDEISMDATQMGFALWLWGVVTFDEALRIIDTPSLAHSVQATLDSVQATQEAAFGLYSHVLTSFSTALPFSPPEPDDGVIASNHQGDTWRITLECGWMCYASS